MKPGKGSLDVLIGLGGAKPGAKSGSGGKKSAKASAAEDFLQAVKDDDAEALALAFEQLTEACHGAAEEEDDEDEDSEDY